VGCQYNLLLDLNVNTGGFKITWPNKKAKEIAESCALDVANRGGVTLEEVGGMMNVTRERVRQIQEKAMEKLSRKPMARKMKEYMDE
jgi:DNA-directed RNA polymerase sigma subunit (sigma70/sigma32)